MNNIKFLLFVVFFSFITPIAAYSEPEELLKLCKSRNFNTYSKGLEKLVQNAPKGTSYKINVILNREIIDGFWENIQQIEKIVQDQNDPNFIEVETYSVSIIRLNDSIASYRIVNLDDTKQGRWYDRNNKMIDSLRSHYERIYKTTLKKSDLFQIKYIYGNNCGFANNRPTLRDELNEALENDDRKLLFEWLRSPIAEKQLYAIEGIYWMEKEGQTFDQEIHSLIKLVAAKGGKAKTCFGNKKGDLLISELVKMIQTKFKNK